MLVIGDRELQFRVNVGPTNSDVAQENYGVIHDLSAIPQASAGRDAGQPKAIFEFCGIKFRAFEGRAGGMANRIFPRLPCRRRFETMPPSGDKQDPPFARAFRVRKVPCRWSRLTVSRESARRCSELPGHRRRRLVPSPPAASTPIWPAMTRTA